jgi:3-deoxy-D-manno-octulosonate 8-phosphate phosphatase (KDO 8-P phosphatase)
MSYPEPSPALAARLARLRLLIFDVDGVLTDGTLGGGEPRSRRWNVKDGFGVYLALRSSLAVALCSGNDHAEIRERAERLRVQHLRLGRLDKGEAVRELLAEAACARGEALFVGDDLFDLPGMAAAGLGACPADAATELLARCDWPLTSRGGHGAAREVIEGVLRARGEWSALVAPFLGPAPEATDG